MAGPVEYQLGGTTTSAESIARELPELVNARRLMPLWRGSNDFAGNSHSSDRLQLFSVPSHRWAMGLLRVWHREDRRPSRGHGGVHLGRSNTTQNSLQDLWMRHALGASGTHSGRQARREPGKLRPQAHRLCASSSIRRSGDLAVHRRVVQSFPAMLAVPPNPSLHPTACGWLRQPPSAGEHKRWADRNPSRIPQCPSARPLLSSSHEPSLAAYGFPSLRWCRPCRAPRLHAAR